MMASRPQRVGTIDFPMRLSSRPILSLLLVGLTATMVMTTQAPSPRDVAREFLRDKMGFSAGEINEVHAGRAVARQMKMRDPVDVNIFGAVHLAAPAEAFIRQVREIDGYERRL